MNGTNTTTKRKSTSKKNSQSRNKSRFSGSQIGKGSKVEKEKVSVADLMNNTNFYRSTRASLDSTTNFQLMSKISKIFDLVTLHSPLPLEV